MSEEIINEYIEHYFEGNNIRLNSEVVKEKLENIFHFSSQNVDKNDKEKIKNEAIQMVNESIKIANEQIRNFVDKIKDKCNCGSCPKYTYDLEKSLFELTKIPDDDCEFINCAIDDLIDMINSNLNIIKIGKIKRGTNKNADISIYDLVDMNEKIKSSMNRALNVLQEKLNKIKQKSKIPFFGLGIGFGIFIVIVLLVIGLYFLFKYKTLDNIWQIQTPKI